ncbi:MAG: hypothetical protein ABH851_06275 [Methanobacteriota archaeon]
MDEKKIEGEVDESEVSSDEEKIEELEGPAEGLESDEEDEEGKFAFALAPIVRLMRGELDNDKMIRRKVKESMNLWLEKLCRTVARKMNESEYTVVEIDDFRTAIEPYEMIDEVEAERKRIVGTLEKIKLDCDSLIRDVNRKFISEGGGLMFDLPEKVVPPEVEEEPSED